MQIVWSAALATGNPVIDRQHEELIMLINALDAAVAAGRDRESLNEAMQRLDAYIVFHFSTEESLMGGLVGASDHVVAHCREHRAFVDEVARQRGDLPALVAYLCDWITQHILRTDRELVRQLFQAAR